MMRPPASGPRTADNAQTLASQPWIFAALMRRVKVADDGHGGRLDRARADALRQPEDDQRRHRPRESAKNRAEQEDRDPDQHHPLAPDEVGELAEHHGGRGLGQKERREHPAVERQAAELRHDLRHGGRDDRGFDRDHEIRRHHGGEHQRAVSRQGESSGTSWEVARHFNGETVLSPNRVRVMRVSVG